jgi:hypothetical protein
LDVKCRSQPLPSPYLAFRGANHQNGMLMARELTEHLDCEKHLF